MSSHFLRLVYQSLDLKVYTLHRGWRWVVIYVPFRRGLSLKGDLFILTSLVNRMGGRTHGTVLWTETELGTLRDTEELPSL